MKPIHTITRRKSRQIFVGDVAIGGDAPISVQSMTNTQTTDVAATLKQIKEIENAGADLVRVSVPTMEAAEAFKEIKKHANIPLITDIHFDLKQWLNRHLDISIFLIDLILITIKFHLKPVKFL